MSVEGLYFSKTGNHFAYITFDREEYHLFIDWDEVGRYRTLKNFSYVDDEGEKYSYIASD
jgi:hypothetical protein